MIPTFALSLDSPGLHLVRIAQWVLATLSIGFLALSMWIWIDSLGLEEQIEEHQAAVSRGQMLLENFVKDARSKGFDFSESRIKSLRQEVEFANQLRAHQGFSWTQFLSDLETAVPSRISMDSIALNFKDGTIALSGSAVSLSDLRTFVDRLDGHKFFHNVVVSSHKAKKLKKKGTALPIVVFSMNVSYSRT